MMEIGLLLLVLFTLPGFLEIAFLTCGAFFSRPKKASKAQTPPKTAILIPAHNEELSIEKTLQSLKRCTGSYEIVVVADNCSDQTAELARKESVQVLERDEPTLRNKAYALNFAIRELKDQFELVIFLDADMQVETNFVEVIQNEVKEGAEVVQVLDTLDTKGESLFSQLQGIAFMAFNGVRPLGRTFWNLSAGLMGTGFGCKREIVQQFPFDVDSIVEDYAYHLKLVKAGKKVHFVPFTSVYATLPKTLEGMKTQRVRWEGGRLRLLFKQSSELLQRILKGETDLIEPLLDLWTMPLGYQALFFLFFLSFARFRLYGGLGLGVLFIHTLLAIHLRKGGLRDYLALLSAPYYLAIKLISLPKVFVGAKKDQPWIRTDRKEKR